MKTDYDRLLEDASNAERRYHNAPRGQKQKRLFELNQKIHHMLRIETSSRRRRRS